MVISWSITEIVRYLNYAVGLVGQKPYPLLWLRYTLFFILYPTGAGSEFILAYTALDLFKVFNENAYYAVVFVLLLYFPRKTPPTFPSVVLNLIIDNFSNWQSSLSSTST